MLDQTHGGDCMSDRHVAELLSALRPFQVATSLLGIGIALLPMHGGFDRLSDIAMMTSTVFVMSTLLFQIISDLRLGKFGLDITALLSMGSALIFGEYLAAAIVALMYAGGQYLEYLAQRRARHEMTALLQRVPRVAIRRMGEKMQEVPVEEIAPGDTLVVRSGDTVPTDGTLTRDASLDEAALTGEAFPVHRKGGEPVMSGVSNAGDLIEMIATKPSRESTMAGIVRLVKQAHESRAPMARLADRYALAFLLITIMIAGLAALITGDPIRAVAVLVVATPCPLILAVPVAWTSGMSRAARIGLLIKGADVLERLGAVRTIVFDKTGTLTDGQPRLAQIETRQNPDDILRLVASLDQGSTHVAARAIVREASERGLVLTPPTRVTEKPGEGISGYVGDTHVAVGAPNYIAATFGNVPTFAQTDAMTAAVAVDGRFSAALFFKDLLREGVRDTLARLKQLGVTELILATGDRAPVARAVVEGLPLDEVKAELKPQDKIDLVHSQAARATTMMVGDGVNDAPALAAADIGLAMGTRGSAAAIEAADAVLLVDRLDRIPDGIMIARRCRRIASQSVIVGIGLSVAAMIFAACGYLKPVHGALLQEVIDVAVVLNALRALQTGSSVKNQAAVRKPAAAFAAVTNTE